MPLGLPSVEDERLQCSLQTFVADINDPRTSANSNRTLRLDIQVLTRLWMASYNLLLAQRTANGMPLTQAMALLHEVLDRLGHLGLAVQSISSGPVEKNPRMLPGAWSLHLQLREFIAELGGLGYDDLEKPLALNAIMPWRLPSLGTHISLPKEGWFR